MSYNERKMLEDVNGDLIPQYYDPVDDEFKPLTNDPRDVRLTGSNVEQLATKGCESVSISRTGTLDLGVYETVFDMVGKECELQSLAIGTDYSAISIYIEPYDVNGDTISTIGVASSNGRIYTPSPMNLDRHSGGTNDFFRNQIYDEENGNYVVTMMRGMVFPNGFRIRIRNQNTSNDRNVALSGLVSTKY